ncbi:unnamed protein product [Mytilus edulis]|uniref:Endonuclease/exonuclease/phosphatase domain-containing protein n=1 Tax=Mytilus edulis TaxID=6550 RepID=A0A8S3TQN2_MYTED|nr:unnamed protein product [Mytilus edulis]
MLTDLDNLNLPDDYIYVTKNRKKFKKASGGIVVIYRKSLEKELNFYNTESQFVLWFKISKSILSLNSDVIFGCVYVPPENSKYSTIEAFEELENELNILTNTENCYVALVGDFNSKTGSLPDYIIPDESVVSMFDLDCDADILEYLYDYENLTRNKITLQRVSQCTCRPNKLQATFSKSDSIVINNRNDKTFVRWKSEQKSEYVDRIHNDSEGILTTVMNKLDKLSVNNDATQNDINNIVLDISKNFKDAAAETFGKRAADELRNISKKDTKALWKILNNLNDSKKKDNNDDISLKALYDHFKILNETVETENDFEQDLEFDTLSDDVELFLNSPVTEDEIKKVVSNLKNGKASEFLVTCSRRRLFSLWNNCLHRHNTVIQCFREMRKRNVFRLVGEHSSCSKLLGHTSRGHILHHALIHGHHPIIHGHHISHHPIIHGHHISHHPIIHGHHLSHNSRFINGHHLSYIDYYNRYHGFRIVDSRFHYNGLTYQLTCSSSQFYSLWGECYTRYHSRSRCFEYLRTQALFAPFGGHGIGIGRRFINGPQISYNDYYYRYHGFRIVDSRFYYNGLAYRLSCSSQRFYSLWGDCFTRYHSRSRCFGYLRTQGLFAPFENKAEDLPDSIIDLPVDNILVTTITTIDSTDLESQIEDSITMV